MMVGMAMPRVVSQAIKGRLVSVAGASCDSLSDALPADVHPREGAGRIARFFRARGEGLFGRLAPEGGRTADAPAARYAERR